MTSSPYVPSGGGQDQDPQTGEWSVGSTAAGQPVADPAAPYGQFDEPVTGYEPAGSTATSGYGAGTSGGTSTTDAAKSEASDLKDTAVDRGQQVAGVAKEQAGAVKDTAVERGQQVAEVAKDEVSRVTSEATGQFKDLLHQGRSQLSDQVSSSQQRLGDLVHSFAEELGSMASSSDKSGPLTDLAHQGSRRVGEIAHWLQTSEPTDVLEQVRNFARRRPVTFLVGSALAGVVVGRLSRSLAAEARDAKLAQSSTPAVTSGYETGGYAAGGYGTGSYDTGSYTTGSYTTSAPVAGTYETGGYDVATGSGTGYDPVPGPDYHGAPTSETTYVEGQGETSR